MSTPDPADPALIADPEDLSDAELRDACQRLTDSGDDDQLLRLLLDELDERQPRPDRAWNKTPIWSRP